MRGQRARLVVAAAMVLISGWTPAVRAAGPELPAAPYKPVPVGTVLDYGWWTCEVVESKGMETVCANGDQRARFFSKFVMVGRPDADGYGDAITEFDCSTRAEITYQSVEESSITEQSKEAIRRRLWPLKLGNSVNFQIRLGSLDVQIIEARLEVQDTDQITVGNRRRNVFIVLYEGTYRGCDTQSHPSFRTRFWYDPVDGQILKSTFLWTTGSQAGVQSEYALRRVVAPRIPSSRTAARSEPDRRTVATDRERPARPTTARTPKIVAPYRPPSPPIRAAPSTEDMKPAPARKAEKTETSSNETAYELAFWDAIKNSKEPEDFTAYLQEYPDGRFASLARLRVRRLHPQSSRRTAAPPKPRAPAKPDPFADTYFGAYHALVIGNNRYRNLPNLETAATDAREVARLLEEDYGFDAMLLIDATRLEVIDTLARYRARLVPDDNLLIYYAGHGVLDELSQTGYWLPVDAAPDSPGNWISVADVTAMVRAIRAKHVLVVADSCYSGTLVRAVPARLRTASERVAWIERVMGKRARTALTSGGLEPVVDSGGGGHSVFAKAFLEALRENDGVLEGQRLFDRIKRPVALNADQTPRYSDIRRAGHEGGDFLFVKQRR